MRIAQNLYEKGVLKSEKLRVDFTSPTAQTVSIGKNLCNSVFLSSGVSI